MVQNLFKSIRCGCLLLLLLAMSACTSEPEESPGLEALRQDFMRANQAGSIAPLLSLYHTEGSDESTLTLLKGALGYELGLPIKEITFEPLSGAPEESIHFTHNEVDYGPSLTPERRMRVVYDLEDGLTSLFTIGQTDDGVWRIVCAKPLPEFSL